MLKLYKIIDSKLHYWETWDNDEKTATVHWGIVGNRGQDKKVPLGFIGRKKIQKEIDAKVSDGYREIDLVDMFSLEIEFLVDGFGTSKDLDKRYELAERLNNLLGWTGLGHVDGGSIGSGTMEVGCLVVDFDLAKKIIEHDLKNTKFSNYSRIYDLNNIS